MLKKIITILLIGIGLAVSIGALMHFRVAPTSQPMIRSVTALRLEILNPVEKQKLTGAVKAWKEEDLSFEVPGRVQWVIDKGKDTSGEHTYSLFDEDGTLVAVLNDEKYKLRLKAAEANYKTAQAQQSALEINVKSVISQQLESAKAERENAEKEYNRIEGLISQKAVSEKSYDKAKTYLLKCQAKYSEVKANIEVKKAEILAGVARLEQLQQEVKNARLDLKRTQLRAPFQGKIADVYANVGANVKAGERVAHLVSVDPITIQLNISAEEDRKFHFSQPVKVYPPGSKTPILAIVNRKAAIADPKTHTFNLELLVRNPLKTVAETIPDDLKKLPSIDKTWPIAMMKWKGNEKLVLVKESIFNDDKGEFIWLITKTLTTIPGAPVHTVKKVYVDLFPGEHSLLGTYQFRIINNPGKLRNMTFVASGVSEGITSGAQVVQIRKQRMFRPGDLVKVILSDTESNEGLYVPLNLISSDSLKNWVFKIVRQEDGSSKALQVFVTLKNRFNESIQIISPDLKTGDTIVKDGAHYLIPNEKINVKSIEKVSL